jgi:hypothetical protein
MALLLTGPYRPASSQGGWALEAQITQQRSANGLLKSALPKTVINAPLSWTRH